MRHCPGRIKFAVTRLLHLGFDGCCVVSGRKAARGNQRNKTTRAWIGRCLMQHLLGWPMQLHLHAARQVQPRLTSQHDPPCLVADATGVMDMQSDTPAAQVQQMPQGCWMSRRMMLGAKRGRAGCIAGLFPSAGRHSNPARGSTRGTSHMWGVSVVWQAMILEQCLAPGKGDGCVNFQVASNIAFAPRCRSHFCTDSPPLYIYRPPIKVKSRLPTPQ